MTCTICNDHGWVCENHPDKTWGSGASTDCGCGGAGMPCICVVDGCRLDTVFDRADLIVEDGGKQE